MRDPISVQVVCGHCEGVGTNSWDGTTCAWCDGDKVLHATLAPDSLAAAMIRLAEAALAVGPFFGKRVTGARLDFNTALAAVVEHPNYQEAKDA